DKLIQKGADLNLKTRNNSLPITSAIIWGGQYELAEYLIEKGADANPNLGEKTNSVPHQVLAEKGPGKYRHWTPETEESYEALKSAMAERGVDWEEEQKSWEDRLRKNGVIE
ncbi:MAG: ankyrin repeat domain-containing protein, partial [Planctomycetota bacterium]